MKSSGALSPCLALLFSAVVPYKAECRLYHHEHPAQRAGQFKPARMAHLLYRRDTRSKKTGSTSACCAMVRSGSYIISWLAADMVPWRLKRRLQLSGTERLLPFRFGGINIHSFNAYIAFSAVLQAIGMISYWLRQSCPVVRTP